MAVCCTTVRCTKWHGVKSGRARGRCADPRHFPYFCAVTATVLLNAISAVCWWNSWCDAPPARCPYDQQLHGLHQLYLLARGVWGQARPGVRRPSSSSGSAVRQSSGPYFPGLPGECVRCLGHWWAAHTRALCWRTGWPRTGGPWVWAPPTTVATEYHSRPYSGECHVFVTLARDEYIEKLVLNTLNLINI